MTRMTRSFYVASVFMFIVATVGCDQKIAASVDPETAPIVTIDQFRAAAKDHATFWTAGSKDGFHYFRLRQGYYRVAASEVEVPELQRRIEIGRAELGVGPGLRLVRSRLDSEKNLIVEVESKSDFMPKQ